MSEFFSGITFPWQKVTPSDDATIRKAVLADGILSGCKLSYSGSTLTMTGGLMLACGREFRHTATQNWAVVDATSGYARLLLTIDTTKTSTKAAFDQIADSIEYAASIDGFPELQQDDINEAGAVYQLPVCVVSLGTGGITGIVEQLGDGSKFRLNTWLPTPEEIGAATPPELLWENASPASKFAAQAVALGLSSSIWAGIVYRFSDSVETCRMALVPIDGRTWSLPITAAGSGRIGGRTATVSADEIVFSEGTYDGSTGNGYVIPQQIYGIGRVSK